MHTFAYICTMERTLITSIYLALNEHRLTQKQVAEKAGISRNTLSDALRRKRGMSLNCFAKIVEAINELKPGAWTWPGNWNKDHETIR